MNILEIDARAKQRCVIQIIDAHTDRQLTYILRQADGDIREMILARLKQLGRELPESADVWTDLREPTPLHPVGLLCFVRT